MTETRNQRPIPQLRVDVELFALFALHAWDRAETLRKTVPRKLDTKKAEAKFEGICTAASALCLVPTSFALRQTVSKAWNEEVAETGERPKVSVAGSNEGMYAWNLRVAQRIVAIEGWS